MDVFTIQTRQRTEMVDVTVEVRASLARSGLREGYGVVFCPHSTAGITVNESFDPDVIHDMILWMDRAVPPVQANFVCKDANSDAHIKASLIGASVTLLVEDGALTLGRWQAVILCEFNGPRQRTVQIKWVGTKVAT